MDGASARCIICRARETLGPASTAQGVGRIPSDVRTNSSSPRVRRRRLRAWLTADWVRPSRSPARVTLRSSISASKTRRRLRSRLAK